MTTYSINNLPSLGALGANTWPDHKRPMLTITRNNTAEVIAYFRDEKARNEFEQWMERLFTALGVDVVEEATRADLA